jgi:SAM-dependent methyltransferase
VSWDATWERTFRTRAWGRYPPEELVRFVMRRFGGEADRSAIRILELGAGPGANLWFLAREGFSAAGIEASPTAAEQAEARLAAEQLSADVRVGDFVDLLADDENGSWNAVVDVSSVQHNRLDAAERTIAEARRVLRPGGAIFSMLVCDGSWGDGLGVELEPRTFTDVPEGPLADAGVTRFYSLDDVRHLFDGFEGLSVERSERTLESRKRRYGHWVVTAVRPA